MDLSSSFLTSQGGFMPALIQLRTQAQGCNCVMTFVKVVTLLLFTETNMIIVILKLA